jgi:hypothetical protein
MAGKNMIVKLCVRGILLLAVALIAMPAQAALTGEYLFENNTLDTSGNDRNGTASGGSTFTTGLYPGSTSALLQTAAGQTVELPPASDFIRNAPGATLTAWIRADELPAEGNANIVVVNNGAAGVGAARALIEYSAGTGFRAIGRQADSGGSTIVSGGSPVVGQTYFIASVFDYVNGDIFLYLDGQPIASNTNVSWNANSADTPNNVARIGSHAEGTSQHWIGALDGVRIFDNAYGPDQILSLFSDPDVIPDTNEPIPGDTDGDGIVEPEDLDPIRANWRMTGQTRAQGNLSGDSAGLVDFTDFRQWKTAILAGGGSLDGIDLGFTTVPEPSTVVAVLCGMTCIASLSRRRSAGSRNS